MAFDRFEVAQECHYGSFWNSKTTRRRERLWSPSMQGSIYTRQICFENSQVQFFADQERTVNIAKIYLADQERTVNIAKIYLARE